MNEEIREIAIEKGVSIAVATDVWQLRQRGRHTNALEGAIIACHRATGHQSFKVGLGQEDEVLRDLGFWSKKLQKQRDAWKTHQQALIKRFKLPAKPAATG